MKKLLKIAAPVGVLALGFVLVQSMVAAKPEPEKKEETQRLVSLFVDQVRQESVTLSVRSQGEVKARTEIDLVPEVSGRIVEISDRFAEGAGFSAGDLLLRIDDQDYRLAVTRAEARVAEAEVQLLTQQATADIKRRQWESTGRTQEPNPLQVNKPQVLEAEAKLRSAKADLAEARINLKRTEIRAPFPGRVMARAVSLGAYAGPQLVLGRIFATDTVEVTLPLTDQQLAEVELPMGFVADAAASAPQVVLSADVGGDLQTWQGEIVRTHASVDPETRLIYAVAQVRNPYAADAGAPLAVGLFVNAVIEGTREVTASVVPREALRNADQVYVVDSDDRLDIRTVDVLSSSDDEVLISSGVSPGERVVTSTIASAVDGMLVQPITSVAYN